MRIITLAVAATLWSTAAAAEPTEPPTEDFAALATELGRCHGTMSAVEALADHYVWPDLVPGSEHATAQAVAVGSMSEGARTEMQNVWALARGLDHWHLLMEDGPDDAGLRMIQAWITADAAARREVVLAAKAGTYTAATTLVSAKLCLEAQRRAMAFHTEVLAVLQRLGGP